MVAGNYECMLQAGVCTQPAPPHRISFCSPQPGVEHLQGVKFEQDGIELDKMMTSNNKMTVIGVTIWVESVKLGRGMEKSEERKKES
jgi:hypothetical protein